MESLGEKEHSSPLEIEVLVASGCFGVLMSQLSVLYRAAFRHRMNLRSQVCCWKGRVIGSAKLMQTAKLRSGRNESLRNSVTTDSDFHHKHTER